MWTVVFLGIVLPCSGLGAEPAAEAFSGAPFGIARARFAVADPAPRFERGRFNLAGDHERILYPVFFEDPRPAGPGGPVGAPSGFTVVFLFRGAEPLKVAASANLDKNRFREFRAAIDPTPAATEAQEKRRAELLKIWWDGYRAILRHWQQSDEHYPVIENYLLWRLPRALNLEAAIPAPQETGEFSWAVRPLQGLPELERLADLIAGTESIRIAMQRETLLDVRGSAAGEALTAPLPAPLSTPPVDLPPLAAEPQIETMAGCVPEESFYIRFPRFTAFRELRSRLKTFGMSLHDTLLGRSLDAGAEERIQTQLALQEGPLSRLFGDLAIGEVAILGFDTFVREGSSLGILFEAKNPALLGATLEKMRAEAMAASKSWPAGVAAETAVECRGRTVKLLEAPGNRIRSFYAVQGKFHLVANCRRLVERFLECAGNVKAASLARDAGFRHARDLHPLSEPEEALVFLSDPFIRQLIGPAYRAEMTRRMRSRAELEIVETALLSARAETGREHSIEELAARGYLPPSILRHADGSTYRQGPDGVRDTLRGARGAYLPIADVPVDRLTASEAQAYEQFRWFYMRQWQRIDPAIIQVRRRPAGSAGQPPAGAAAGEELELRVDILPFAREPYQILRAFSGPASPRSLRPLPGELASFSFEGGRILSDPAGWFRAGLLDFEGPRALDNGGPRPGSLLEGARWYGLVPCVPGANAETIQSGFLTARRAEDGYYSLGIDVLGRQVWGKPDGAFLIISADKEVLDAAAGQLAFTEEPPAQARFSLESLQGRRLVRALAVENYLRRRAISRAGANLLSLIHRELKVPLESCPAAGERILAQRIVCPAGGEYLGNAYPVAGEAFFKSNSFLEESLSTAQLEEKALAAMADFIGVFKGLKAGLTLEGRSLHAEVRIQLQNNRP